ncbi:hypothetical protein BC332_23174 [Capsicum chinense]|nr:hypothetical protein BC332_23174 [Capsicum chinense]
MVVMSSDQPDMDVMSPDQQEMAVMSPNQQEMDVTSPDQQEIAAMSPDQQEMDVMSSELTEMVAIQGKLSDPDVKKIGADSVPCDVDSDGPSFCFFGNRLNLGISAVNNVVIKYPPYIPSKDIGGLQAEVGRHEPRLALDGGASGMNDLIHLCDGAVSMLKPGGFFAFETNGDEQSKFLVHYIETKKQGSFSKVKTVSDFAGILRFITGFRGR